MRVRHIALFAACCFAANAQTFEVASVKPQKWTGSGGVYVMATGDTLHGEHCDLNTLVEYAYNLKDFQLSGGPAWASHGQLAISDLYQVVAKAPAGTTPSTEDFRRMLQTLLAERFHLQIHHVEKQVPVFNLVVDKGGPKLKPTSGDKTSLRTQGAGPGGLHIDAVNETIQHAVQAQIGLYAGRPVIEKTGLDGHYDFSLEWSQDDNRTDLPSYASALKDQLGLRLEPSTAPFDTVVIDHAEKPTEN